ncbi:MAG: PQQ-binding-like beta-propeller repeat protein [Raoultibacter sp.]
MRYNHALTSAADQLRADRAGGIASRLLALFVSFVLALSLVPGVAWADDLALNATALPDAALAVTTTQDARTANDADLAVATGDQNEGVVSPKSEDLPANMLSETEQSFETGALPETDLPAVPRTPSSDNQPTAPDSIVAPATTALNVRFSLFGDSVHGATGHIAYQKWLSEAAYEIVPPKGAALTALDVFKQVLDLKQYTYTIVEGDYGAFLTDITTPAGVKLANGDNGSWGGWGYTVNGVSPDDGMGVHAVSAGDVVCVKYTDGAEWGEKPPAHNPDLPLPDYDSAWPNYQGNGAATTTNTATSADEAVLAFKTNLKGTSSWAIVSEPLIVNDNIYIAVNNMMYLIDTTGAIKLSAPLMQAIGYTCRPMYSGGKILVPLDGGHIQALAADTLKTVWFSNAVYDSENAGADASKHQSDTTLTLAGNSVFFGTWASSVGVYRCIDVVTGKATWTHQNKEGGYYWSGAAYMKNCDSIVVAGEDGKLTSLAAADGKVRATYDLGAAVRSTVIAFDEATVIVADTSGTLHKVSVEADGSFIHQGGVKFSSRSTSTPTLYDGRAIVGGDLGAEAGYKGVLAVIDVATMQVVQRITTPAEVKSAPLVSAQTEGTYVYFTANTKPGAVYVAKLGAGDKDASVLYAPEGKDANYCTASLVVGADGTLYYTNDSGMLFALKSTKEKPVDPPVNPPVVPVEPSVPGDRVDPDSGGNAGWGVKAGWDASGNARSGSNAKAQPKVMSSSPVLQAVPTARKEEPQPSAASNVSDQAVPLAASTGARSMSEADGSAAALSHPEGGPNPWAIAGIAAGGIGLVGVAGYVLRARRIGLGAGKED